MKKERVPHNTITPEIDLMIRVYGFGVYDRYFRKYKRLADYSARHSALPLMDADDVEAVAGNLAKERVYQFLLSRFPQYLTSPSSSPWDKSECGRL